MERRHAFDLRNAAPGKLGRFRDAHTCLPQSDNAAVVRKVGLTAGVPPCPPRNLDPLSLTLAPGLVVVTRSLKSNAQQHVLHRPENDPRHAGAVGNKVR